MKSRREIRAEIYNAKRRKRHLVMPDADSSAKTVCGAPLSKVGRWSTDPQETECKNCLNRFEYE